MKEQIGRFVGRKYKAAIFDLDGVIVDTARYHYMAWKRLADELGFEFAAEQNERLKGISRQKSIEILLSIGDIELDEARKNILAEKKNSWYVEYLNNITESDILKGAGEFIKGLKDAGIKVALGSASKNAGFILKKLCIEMFFDVIIDGNKVMKAKPDPEVFLMAARELGVLPEECVVFEDSRAGLAAENAASMFVVGIGEREILKEADMVVKGLYEFKSTNFFIPD